MGGSGVLVAVSVKVGSGVAVGGSRRRGSGDLVRPGCRPNRIDSLAQRRDVPVDHHASAEWARAADRRRRPSRRRPARWRIRVGRDLDPVSDTPSTGCQVKAGESGPTEPSTGDSSTGAAVAAHSLTHRRWRWDHQRNQGKQEQDLDAAHVTSRARVNVGAVAYAQRTQQRVPESVRPLRVSRLGAGRSPTYGRKLRNRPINSGQSGVGLSAYQSDRTTSERRRERTVLVPSSRIETP